MKAKSIKRKSTEEIKTALSNCLSDGFHPTVAIVFASIKLDRHAICELLHKEGIDVLEATNAGEFIDGNQSEGGAAILLINLNRNHYNILFEDIGLHYPLQVEGAGYPVLRKPFLADSDNNAIKPDFLVPEGTSFRFSVTPDFQILDTVVESSEEIGDNDLPNADALIVFSCIARNLLLGPMASLEVEGLAKTWNKPMAGFFSMGEFGKVKNGNIAEYHGSTCSWVALKEK